MWASHLAYRGAGRTRSVEGCGWSSLFVRIDGEREEGEDRVGIVAMERVGKRGGRQKEGGRHVGMGGAAGAGGGRSSPRAFHLHAHDPKIILYRGANGEREGGENRVGTLAIGRVGKRGESGISRHLVPSFRLRAGRVWTSF